MARARVKEVLTTKQDPLAVLVEIANDETVDVQVRVTAASSAAPYLFPRLSMSVIGTAPISAKDDSAGILNRLLARIDRMVVAGPPTIEVEREAEVGREPEFAEAEEAE